MGWTPRDVRLCGLADFGASFEGWCSANVPKDNKEPDFSADAMERLDKVAQRERVRAWRRAAA